nr:hypothetical protein [Photobacterium damselae]
MVALTNFKKGGNLKRNKPAKAKKKNFNLNPLVPFLAKGFSTGK